MVINAPPRAYMGLSAYLFNITQNKTYYDATQSSLMFIRSHFLESSIGTIWDAIDLSDCHIRPNIWTFEAGLYLEALSVFGYSTGDRSVIEE